MGNAKFNFRLLTQLTLDTKPPKTQIQRIKSNLPACRFRHFVKNGLAATALQPTVSALFAVRTASRMRAPANSIRVESMLQWIREQWHQAQLRESAKKSPPNQMAEREALLQAVQHHRSSRRLGEALGLSHTAVLKKLKKYGIVFPAK